MQNQTNTNTLANWNPGFLHLDLSWSYIRLHVGNTKSMSTIQRAGNLLLQIVKASTMLAAFPKNLPPIYESLLEGT